MLGWGSALEVKGGEGQGVNAASDIGIWTKLPDSTSSAWWEERFGGRRGCLTSLRLAHGTHLALHVLKGVAYLHGRRVVALRGRDTVVVAPDLVLRRDQCRREPQGVAVGTGKGLIRRPYQDLLETVELVASLRQIISRALAADVVATTGGAEEDVLAEGHAEGAVVFEDRELLISERRVGYFVVELIFPAWGEEDEMTRSPSHL